MSPKQAASWYIFKAESAESVFTVNPSSGKYFGRDVFNKNKSPNIRSAWAVHAASTLCRTASRAYRRAFSALKSTGIFTTLNDAFSEFPPEYSSASARLA